MQLSDHFSVVLELWSRSVGVHPSSLGVLLQSPVRQVVKKGSWQEGLMTRMAGIQGSDQLEEVAPRPGGPRRLVAWGNLQIWTLGRWVDVCHFYEQQWATYIIDGWARHELVSSQDRWGRLRIGNFNGEMLLVTMVFSEYSRQGIPTDFLANSGCNSGRIGYGSRRPATFFWSTPMPEHSQKNGWCQVLSYLRGNPHENRLWFYNIL